MEMLDKWHDLFVVLGAAAGTLIGSMFVVVSIGSGLVRGGELTSRIFVTPTIIHLAAVLMSCAFVMMPTLTRFGLGAAAGIGGIAFLGYAGRNMFHIHRRAELLWSDWVWYGVAPLCAYLLMLAGAVMVLEEARFAIEAIAVALALLVISGIRNAWDLILFFLERRVGEGDTPAA